MLLAEQTQPHKLAYDRPSPKLLGFLRKYYNLVNYIPQNNNFVIYNQYFEKSNSTAQDIQKPGPVPQKSYQS